MKAPKTLYAILICIVCLVIVSNCTFGRPANDPENTPDQSARPESSSTQSGDSNDPALHDDGTKPANTPEQSEDPETPDTVSPTPSSPDHSGGTQAGSIDEIISGMTLEEKVGQLFFIAYRKEAGGAGVLKMDESLEKMLQKYHPGGFILFSENLETIDQTVTLVNALQKASDIPLFIAMDEEGGIVTRLNKAPNMPSTVMPPNYTIGLTQKPENAYLAANIIAEEISSLGCNMDFAPVADIYSNPANRVIGRRAYGNDAATVSPMISQAVKGFEESSVVPVLKHFPGHGDTLEDSHTGAATVQHDMARLEASELIPFKDGIAAGADVIMTAHILLPNVTVQDVPATLSKEIVTDLLRRKMGFDGIVVTDALEMSAISAFYTEEEAAVKAIEAGVDMLLMPADLDKAFHAILQAVSSGSLSEERINASLRRILTVKQKYRILSGALERPDPHVTLGSQEHLKAAEKIRKEAGSQ